MSTYSIRYTPEQIAKPALLPGEKEIVRRDIAVAVVSTLAATVAAVAIFMLLGKTGALVMTPAIYNIPMGVIVTAASVGVIGTIAPRAWVDMCAARVKASVVSQESEGPANVSKTFSIPKDSNVTYDKITKRVKIPPNATFQLCYTPKGDNSIYLLLAIRDSEGVEVPATLDGVHSIKTVALAEGMTAKYKVDAYGYIYFEIKEDGGGVKNKYICYDEGERRLCLEKDPGGI